MARAPLTVVEHAIANLTKVDEYLRTGMETTTHTTVDLLDTDKGDECVMKHCVLPSLL